MNSTTTMDTNRDHSRIQTAAEYLAAPSPTAPVLVEPALLVRGGVTMLVSESGKGASVFCLNRAIRWAAGVPLFAGSTDLAPVDPLRTLVVGDGAPGLFHRQLGLMIERAPLSEDASRQAAEKLLVWGDGGSVEIKLDAVSASNLSAQCASFSPDIVLLSLRSLTGEDPATLAANLQAFARDHNCAVHVTHGPKSGSAALRLSLEEVAATVEHFEIAKGGEFREWSVSKLRYGGGGHVLPIRMEWDPATWWYRHVPLERTTEHVLDLLAKSDDPVTIKALLDATGEKEHTMRKLMKALVEDGQVRKLSPVQSGKGGSTGNRYVLGALNAIEF